MQIIPLPALPHFRKRKAAERPVEQGILPLHLRPLPNLFPSYSQSIHHPSPSPVIFSREIPSEKLMEI